MISAHVVITMTTNYDNHHVTISIYYVMDDLSHYIIHNSLYIGAFLTHLLWGHLKEKHTARYQLGHGLRQQCDPVHIVTVRLTVNLPGPICVVFISVLQLHCLVPEAGLATGL